MNYIDEITVYFERLKQTLDKISKEDLNTVMMRIQH